MPGSTVIVTEDHENHVLIMTWARNVRHEDISAAFEFLLAQLDAAPYPLYVIVDLSSRPAFPVLQTIYRALPAFVHPKLARWLVVGESSLGRIIEDTLVRLSGVQNHVLWFGTMTDVHSHLNAQVSISA